MMVQQDRRLENYESAVRGLGYYVWENPGYLSIGGPDRRAFLQRQTTNDTNSLDSAQAVTTVLTTAAARILDVLTLLEEGETLRAITLPGHGASTLQYLRSRIFFTDKVNVEEASGEAIQIDLIGPGLPNDNNQPTGQFNRLFGEQLRGTAMANRSGNAEVDLDKFQARLLSLRNLGHRMLCPVARVHELLAALEKAGAARLPYETFQVLRVEAGMPSGGHELSEEYTPLEVGLDWAISGTKGCYTGQEVIARQIGYDKVTRRLAGLRLEQPAEAGQKILSPDEGRPIGAITSAVVSPRLGPIALAVLRRPYDEKGGTVRIGDGEGNAATVGSLPF